MECGVDWGASLSGETRYKEPRNDYQSYKSMCVYPLHKWVCSIVARARRQRTSPKFDAR